MNIIVAVYRDWGIGYNGRQTIVLPEDRKLFRELTTGGVVIAGRKTFEELRRPLPDRRNIVLTRDRMFTADGVDVAHSLAEVLKLAADYDPGKVFVIGGGEIYRLFLPLCNLAYVTKIDALPLSDTFFPNLDDSPDWSLVNASEIVNEIVSVSEIANASEIANSSEITSEIAIRNPEFTMRCAQYIYSPIPEPEGDNHV